MEEFFSVSCVLVCLSVMPVVGGVLVGSLEGVVGEGLRVTTVVGRFEVGILTLFSVLVNGTPVLFNVAPELE